MRTVSMDVDGELEGNLLQQFSSLGTTDKEVLIARFQELLGDQLNPPECAFYLDMNNWNLQAAICSYYDYQPNERLPKLTFLKDVTIGEGEAVPPNTTFTKTWKLGNSGEEVWPPGCQLKFCVGDNLASTDRVLVDALLPHSTTEISVEMRSPAEAGTYQGQWRMCTATGMFFGETIWVIVRVAEGGLLGVTQQLSRFGSDFVQNPCPVSGANPFLSPSKSNHSDTDSAHMRSAFHSPNNSLVAQQGSPYIDQLSPSPTLRAHQGSNGVNTPARSLFQESSGNCTSEDCDTIEEMS